MQQSMDGSQVLKLQCGKCGQLMSLTQIEPDVNLDHDLRTFECAHCSSTATLKVRNK